jgi:hypothetical protein
MVKEPVIEGLEIPVLNVISLKFYPLQKHPSQVPRAPRPKDRHHGQGFEKSRSESDGQQGLDPL